ncbi:MAG: HAMP domain-containing sensor histidine kinase [Polaromonas sp.]
MLRRLPYRFQIPLGLALAVTLAALLVSVVTAQLSARSARQDITLTLQRAMALLAVQSKPLLLAEDTWGTFALLRNTAALLPDVDKGSARAAILDVVGHFIAASDPARLPTGQTALGMSLNGQLLLSAKAINQSVQLMSVDGGMTLIETIQSEDGQVLGYVYVEVDAAAFAPNWAALAKPALGGALLAIALLGPLGWWLGRRMARPVAEVADCIARIGRVDLETLQSQIPTASDPELDRISGAVRRLLAEMAVAQQAEQRALAAERLAAVGRIAAVVAHEINNPLAGLLTATQTLRLHGGEEQTRLRTVSLLDRGLQQIQVTAAALLPHAKVDERALEASDLADVIELSQSAAQRQQVQVTAELNISAPLLAPSSALRQVMLNLLLNAIKAAGHGGRVVALLTGDAHKVRVTFSNSGMPLLQSEFDQRLTDEGGIDPRGFGLWICREMAVRYGGGFGLGKTDNFATTLDFWIPNRAFNDYQETVTD